MDYTLKLYSKADFNKLTPMKKENLVNQFEFNAIETSKEIEDLFKDIVNEYENCYYSLQLYSSTALYDKVNLKNLCADIFYLNQYLI